MLFGLVRDRMLTIAQAAAKLDMTEEQFKEAMANAEH